MTHHPVRNILSFVRFSCAALVALEDAQPASAQATSGTIQGLVTDPTGAVIPGAIITVKDEDKGVTFTGRSDGAGAYSVLNVTPGVYQVTASHPGFADSVAPHTTIVIDQKRVLNFRLTQGTVSTTVEVNDQPALLQTQTAEVGTVIGGNTITDLPLLSRNFYDLTTLVPGVVQVGGSINSYALSVGGQREFANSILLDGVESTTNRTQDVTVRPSVRIPAAGIQGDYLELRRRVRAMPPAALCRSRPRPAPTSSTATPMSSTGRISSPLAPTLSADRITLLRS